MAGIPNLASFRTQASATLNKISNYPKGSPETMATVKNDESSTMGDKRINYITYPEDLLQAINNEYGAHYIVFYINVQHDSKVKLFPMSDINDTMDKPTYETRATTEIAKTSKNITDAINSTTGLLSNVGINIPTIKTRATRQLKAAIALYSPNNFTTNYGIEWSGAETAMQQLAVRGVDISTGLATAAIPWSDKTIKGEAGKGAQVALGGAVSTALNTGPIKDVLGLTAGMASNSKKEMLFRSVDFRTFNFEYKFSPKNLVEYSQVLDIIAMFKFHMHPEYKENMAGFVYIYPSEFDILHFNADGENLNLPKHTSCVLTNMTVNYTPNGQMNTFVGGAPTQIDISLTFKELALLTKNEIIKGY